MARAKESILITGAAGFIGSHLARRALDVGYKVYTIDNLLTGSESNIPRGVKFVRGDIANESLLKKIPAKNCVGVMHLAAQSSGEISAAEPTLDLRTNTLGTLNLLNWCQANSIERFLYASSMSAYGNVTGLPVKESAPLEPLSFYGISKKCSEHYINYFARKGMKTTVFRLFSVYGPGQNLANMKQGIVSIYLSFLMKKKEIHVKGSGERFRDLIYIDDVVEAWMKALSSRRSAGETFNLATGKKTLVRELVAKLIEAWGEDPKRYPVRYQGSTPDDQFGLYADISRVKRALYWHPQTKLEDGLAKMTAWVK